MMVQVSVGEEQGRDVVGGQVEGRLEDRGREQGSEFLLFSSFFIIFSSFFT